MLFRSNSLYVRIAGCQVPKPRCLSPAANSLYVRIAGCQVPKPRCLSPAANSLYVRIAGCQVPKPRCLSPAANSLYVRIAGRQVPKPSWPVTAVPRGTAVTVPKKAHTNCLSILRLAFHSWQALGFHYNNC